MERPVGLECDTSTGADVRAQDALHVSQRLLNKVAVVIGASRGIGHSIAQRFIDEGAKVTLFARDRSRLTAVADASPARALVVSGDVRLTADLQELADTTVRRFGSVDVLVHTAGMAPALPIADCTPAAVDELFDVNFMGAVQSVRVLLPHLNRRASLIFLTTFPGTAAVPGWSAYNASKGALKAFAQSLSAELAARRIRVNCIAPGPTRTKFWDHPSAAATADNADSAKLRSRHRPGDMGRPDDVAETALFLASDFAAHISGQEIVVDGGQSGL